MTNLNLKEKKTSKKRKSSKIKQKISKEELRKEFDKLIRDEAFEIIQIYNQIFEENNIEVDIKHIKKSTVSK